MSSKKQDGSIAEVDQQHPSQFWSATGASAAAGVAWSKVLGFMM